MLKKKEIEVRVCDICGKECKGTCIYCGRDICEEHNYVPKVQFVEQGFIYYKPFVCEKCAGEVTLKDFIDKYNTKIKQMQALGKKRRKV